jgi:hypothetical protein
MVTVSAISSSTYKNSPETRDPSLGPKMGPKIKTEPGDLGPNWDMSYVPQPISKAKYPTFQNG